MTSIKLIAHHERFYTNPCLTSPGQLAKLVDEGWLHNKIEQIIRRLCNRPALLTVEESYDNTPYTGVGGIGYAFLRTARAFEPKPNLEKCKYFVDLQKKYANETSRDDHACYLTGDLGLLTIDAIYEHMGNKPFDSVVDSFKGLVNHYSYSGYMSQCSDELFNGRAGFLAAVLTLRMETGHDIVSDDDVKSILRAMVNSGRAYAKSRGLPCPIMYAWMNAEYLGAAHGLSGILQMFFAFWDLLEDDMKGDVIKTLDWFLTTQSKDGNFPSATDEIGHPSPKLVHWCHGAPGVIHLLIAAYVALRQEKYLEAARKCADLIWEKGILRKGPGICHGVAGNGYAFLLMYRLTLEEEFLMKAKAFAAVMMDPTFEKLARTPDSPLSLFEGWAGSLCFLVDLLHPMNAQFPMVPIRF